MQKCASECCTSPRNRQGGPLEPRAAASRLHTPPAGWPLPKGKPRARCAGGPPDPAMIPVCSSESWSVSSSLPSRAGDASLPRKPAAGEGRPAAAGLCAVPAQRVASLERSRFLLGEAGKRWTPSAVWGEGAVNKHASEKIQR